MSPIHTNYLEFKKFILSFDLFLLLKLQYRMQIVQHSHESFIILVLLPFSKVPSVIASPGNCLIHPPHLKQNSQNAVMNIKITSC